MPNRWAEELGLGSWVSKQRTRKKALDHGEPSEGMTAARAAKLEALGFAWELSAAARSKQQSKGNRDDAGWEAQLTKLKAYKRKHGDCNVPQGWAEDKPLGSWVNNQRVRKRALDHGEPSEGMTAARVAKLDALGFAWELSAAAISKQRREAARDDAGWEAQLAKLKAYKTRHGDRRRSSNSGGHTVTDTAALAGARVLGCCCPRGPGAAGSTCISRGGRAVDCITGVDPVHERLCNVAWGCSAAAHARGWCAWLRAAAARAAPRAEKQLAPQFYLVQFTAGGWLTY